MAGESFFEGIEALKERVGQGDLVGKVEVDQHYAQHQHETFGYLHIRGGGPHYLRNPLLDNAARYVSDLADNVLEGDLAESMAESMEDLQDHLDPAAPIDAEPNPIKLRQSGHPTVTDDGTIVYDRPQLHPREPFGASVELNGQEEE